MRKLLLAGVAGLGAWGLMAADASAQSATSSTIQSPATVTSYGVNSVPVMSNPTPGTVVVRLNGRVRFYAGAAWDRDANPSTGANTGNKVQSYGFIEYGRLYPGFDGIAANGLKYGANMEIRQDAGGNAGGGAFGSISGQGAVRAELYFRRVWGYIGTDAIGTFRFGSTDQPTSLYLTGNFENFNDGGWNGDAPSFAQGRVVPAWPFADVGSYYTTNKIVYLSPQIFGFDMGVSYEPTTANLSGGTNCNAAAAGCDNLSSIANYSVTTQSTAAGAVTQTISNNANLESQRRRNTFDVLLRYRGSFGPVGIAATAAYVGGSHVNDTSTVPVNYNPLAGATKYNYDGLSVGDFGAAITVGGASVGGHYQTGRWNGYIGGTLPKGLPDSDAWILGASYTFGPAIIGAHWFVSETAGDLSNAVFGRRRREQGVAVGGTYSIAPGVSLFLSGLWGERKQNGFDFTNNAGVTTATGIAGQANHNTVNTTIVSLGTAFSW